MRLCLVELDLPVRLGVQHPGAQGLLLLQRRRAQTWANRKHRRDEGELHADAGDDHAARREAETLEGARQHEHGRVGDGQHQARHDDDVPALCDHREDRTFDVLAIPNLLRVAREREERVIEGQGGVQHEHHHHGIRQDSGVQ